MAQGQFTAAVGEWARDVKGAMLAIKNETIERIVEIAQTPVAKGGNMPVDTGFLRSSIAYAVGSAAGFPPRAKPDNAAPGSFAYAPGSISLVLVGAELGDPIEVVYTANYARFVEYGARGRPGRRFVGLAAQQFPRIVSEVEAEAKARFGVS